MVAGMASWIGRGHGDSVRRAILRPFAALLLFIVLAVVIGAYQLQTRAQRDALNADTAAVRQMFSQQIQQDAAGMQALSAALLNDPDLLRAVAEHNSPALLRKLEPLYLQLHDTRRITHLSFTRPDHSVLLRVHNPEDKDDVIDRKTLSEAEQTGAPSWGIELGKLGRLSLRYVGPVHDHGKLIGFIEMGEDLTQLADEFHRILGHDLLMLVWKDYLERDKWEQGMRMSGRQGSWDQLNKSVAIAQTMKTIPFQLGLMLEEGNKSRRVVVSGENGRRLLHVSFLPLIDKTQQELGSIVIVQDVTAAQSAMYRLIVYISAVVILAGVAVYMLFAAILGAVEAELRRKQDEERRLLQLLGEQSRVLEVETLAEMGRTVEEMARQMEAPLNDIGKAIAAAETLVDADPQRTLALLAMIRQEKDDCRAVVSRLRAACQLQESRPEPILLQRLLHETASGFQQDSPHRRKVQVSCPDQPVTLTVDAAQLRHALTNLLDNAALAMADSPAPVVLLLRPQMQDKEDGWTMTVRDSGPGIAAESLERVFLPFYSTRPEASGLGLPVARHIALLHGGTLTAVNRPEGGVDLELWLPLHPRQKDEDDPEEESGV